MSGHGLLGNVFSCSSPASKTISKRKLRQTRSLDPALIRNCGTQMDGNSGGRLRSQSPPGLRVEDAGALLSPPASPGHHWVKPPLPCSSGPSTPLDLSPTTSDVCFDYDVTVRGGAKRNTAWDVPFLVRSTSVPSAGSGSTLFSPRRWLQKKLQQTSSRAYIVWRSEGDFTWNQSGGSVRLTPTAIQSLSELERVRLQEVAFNRLHQDHDLGCQITIPKDGQKRKKSLRRKLDSLAKEKNKDKECVPQAFGMALSQVIANDRTHRQRQDSLRQDPPTRDDHKDPSDLVSSILQFATKRPSTKELSSSNSSLSSTSETANESTSPNTPEPPSRTRRRGAMSVDSITDLDDNQSRLLEALQLSLPSEVPSKKEKQRDKKLSLNPIYRQVPRLVDSCCQHLEKYGLQTVGIFRVGSSKKRVRQLREEFDRGVDVRLDAEHSVHDVAALLKEFLRDMPDPLLTKELYTAFINTALLDCEEQLSATQLLIYLLPACNSDTLHRLLQFLATVAGHAQDSLDKDGREVTGNKMTSLNLATIFGPNLLHKQKSSDKEFSVQSSARAEESTVVIAVLQRMITTFHSLFMVPPDLQNEVLMSLLETDPDVVDYLLRRKASQSPDLLRSDDPFSSLSERRSSSDSNKVSSGEVSPYDNNSPVLSERRAEGTSPGSERLCCDPERCTLVGQVAGQTRDTHQSNSKEDHANIWGDWHSTLKPGLKDRHHAGSHSNMSECSSRGSQDGIDSLQCYPRPSVRWAPTTTLGVAEYRPHPPVCSSSQGKAGKPCLQLSLDPVTPPHPHIDGQSAASSTEDLELLLQGIGHQTNPNSAPSGPNIMGRSPPPLYGGPSSRFCRTPSKPAQPATPSFAAPPHRFPTQGMQNSIAPHTDSMVPLSPEWLDWQRDRWQIWQLLSSENADTLPETLV